MRRVVPIIVALLVAGGAAGWWFDVPARLGWTEEAEQEFVLYGNVDIRQATLGFRVSGRIAGLSVDEGDAVKAGDVLATLDARSYESALRVAQANAAALRATLDKLKAGPRPAEIAQAKATYDQHLASVRYADLALTRAKQLRQQGTVSQGTLDEAEATSDEAKAQAEAAKSALNLLEEGTRAEEIAAAEAQLRAAEAEVETACLSLEDARLVAPSDGIILSRVEEEGAIVSSSDTVFVLSLTRPVWVRAYVGEPDLGRVHPGMAVRVASDTRPGQSYEGTVGFISPVAEFTPKSVETPELRTDLVYRLRVVIDNPGPDLRQGMPVTVQLEDAGS
ncbi:secretion protein HlyD [Consotaella aegiceratis]|uniref:secretion protein HlyD n=1 Tax=Consotaella aegiceratis TaxID=3097961 RepID=UPI002F3E69A2